MGTLILAVERFNNIIRIKMSMINLNNIVVF